MTGHLHLVGTPIGNLGDISQRTRETLSSVSHLYAEDTRHTRALLSHLGIEGKKVLSLHAHSSRRTIDTALEILKEGKEVALVTDAGMPSISDPGTGLVRAARSAEIDITVVPGPSAVTAAVALSGLVDGPFTFLGFLPRKGRARDEMLYFIKKSTFPVIIFESPHRMSQTLTDLEKVCGPQRQVAVCRELTKHFEETRVLPLEEFTASSDQQPWRGECTLVIQRAPPEEANNNEEFDIDEAIRTQLARGSSVRDVTELIGRDLARRGQRTKRREIYARVLAVAEGLAAQTTPST